MNVVSRILTVSALAAFTLSAFAPTPTFAQSGSKMSKSSMSKMSKSKMSKKSMGKKMMGKKSMKKKSMAKKPMKAPIMTGDATKSGGGPQLNPAQNGPGTTGTGVNP